MTRKNMPTGEKPEIVLSNDDGVFAEGLTALADALAEIAHVWVVAPDRERSGSSHSITLHHPLRARELPDGRFAVDGTPTDCVNLALHHLLADREIKMVVSGINAGLNIGDDVTYSGTLGAAFEAHLLEVPAVGFSQDTGGEYSYERAAEWAAELVRTLLGDPLEPSLLLNVNFPAGDFEGWSMTRLGRRFYREVVVEKEDPRGRSYYWIGGRPEWQGGEGTDHDALEHGVISVTPLHLDLTDFAQLEKRAAWHRRLSAPAGAR